MDATLGQNYADSKEPPKHVQINRLMEVLSFLIGFLLIIPIGGADMPVAAKTEKGSPIYGMPVFDVEKTKNLLFVKRLMGGRGLCRCAQ